MGFANLGILVAIGRSFGRRMGGRGASGDAVADAFPFLRATILLAYGAAAIAKLNSGVSDLELSCAVSMTEDALAILGERAPSLPAPIIEWLPHTVAGIELVIPVMLLLRRTRVLGVVTVVLFHLAMSLSPTATAGDFTVVLFSLAFLFLPPRSGEVFRTARARVRTVAQRRLPVAGSTWALLLLVAVTGMVGGQGFGHLSVEGNRNWVSVASLGLGLGILLLIAARRTWRQRLDATAEAMPRRWEYFPILVLVLLTSSAPYIGSKTVAVFTMYSNLQTEGQESNHFLIPRLPREAARTISSSSRSRPTRGCGGSVTEAA